MSKIAINQSYTTEEQIANDHTARAMLGKPTARCYWLGVKDFDSVAKRTNVATDRRLGVLGLDLFTHSGVIRVVLNDSLAEGEVHAIERHPTDASAPSPSSLLGDVREQLLRRAHEALSRNGTHEDERAVALIDSYLRLSEAE